MICPKCDEEVFDSDNFCSNCGFSLQKECPACTQINRINKKFCTSCGYNFQNEEFLKEITKKEDTQKEEFDLLSFLFIPKGRISRKNYIYYFLFFFCTAFILGIYVEITNKSIKELEFILSIVSIIFLYPTIVVTWKRLQDFNVHGVFSLLLLIPLKYFSLIFIITVGAIKGTEGKNNFGLKKK